MFVPQRTEGKIHVCYGCYVNCSHLLVLVQARIQPPFQNKSVRTMQFIVDPTDLLALVWV